MIVYGFPSKLSALQFEWAWQNPDRSRHLHKYDPTTKGDLGPIFRKDNTRNRVERKALVAAALLRAHPFAQLPLHARCFTQQTFGILKMLTSIEPPTCAAKTICERGNLALVEHVAAIPWARNIGVSLDLGGLSNSVTPQDDKVGPFLDLNDKTFRIGHSVLGKWKRVETARSTTSMTCYICEGVVSTENHDSFVVCPDPGEDSTCLCVTHLTCLGRYQDGVEQRMGLLPLRARCPECHSSVSWGDVVRSCYRRREAVQGR